MARIRRPGETAPTPPPGGGGRRKPNHPNKPKTKNKNKGKGSGAGTNSTTEDTQGLTQTHAVDANAPVVPFSDSMYGYTGSVPYLNTDEGILAANADPEGYLTYLHGRKGFSMPGTVGGAQPFNQWLMNERYPALMQAWDAASLVNPNLNFVQYMQTMGVPADAANHVAGYQPPMGTGQADPLAPRPPITGSPATSPPRPPVGGYNGRPGGYGSGAMGSAPAVDTGNPFTSSSGIGAPAVPKMTDMPAHLQATSAFTVPKTAEATNPFNKNRKPNAYKRWQKNNQASEPSGAGGNPTYNPPSGAGGSQTNLGLAALEDRKAFLSLSPELRGEKAVDSYSGRWSPWG